MEEEDLFYSSNHVHHLPDLVFERKDGSRNIEVGSITSNFPCPNCYGINFIFEKHSRRANGFQSPTTYLLLEPFGEKLLFEFTVSSIKCISHLYFIFSPK